MKFETKYFGTVEVPPDEVITFPNGLFGFEEERSFLLLPFAGSEYALLAECRHPLPGLYRHESLFSASQLSAAALF